MSVTRTPVSLLIDLLDPTQEKGRERLAVGSSYAVFGMVAWLVATHFSDRDWSAVVVLGSGFQCLGFFLLLQKTRVQRSVSGISGKTLEMYAVAIVCRLSSTLFMDGYLPIDRSGDLVYQIADITSLLLVLQLLYCVNKKYKSTYQPERDSLPIWKALPALVVAAMAFHGTLNHNAMFDIIWTLSMNIDTVAMLPQLWLLANQGGTVEALTSNYVAALFLNSLCKLAFWFFAHKALNKPENTWVENGAMYWLVAAHVLQVMQSADFMFHFIRARLNAEVGTSLPAAEP